MKRVITLFVLAMSLLQGFSQHKTHSPDGYVINFALFDTLKVIKN